MLLSICWVPPVKILIVNLLFQKHLGFYGFLSYKAPFIITMEFSEVDTREATKD